LIIYHLLPLLGLVNLLPLNFMELSTSVRIKISPHSCILLVAADDVSPGFRIPRLLDPFLLGSLNILDIILCLLFVANHLFDLDFYSLLMF
jgi:hypothetical protein